MPIRQGRTVLDNLFQKNELLDAFSWRLLLPDFHSPRVLSIMPPNAAHLDALVELFDDVTSLESCHSRAACEDVSGVDRQQGIHQIKGSVLSLPFSNDSFDLVVMNEFTSGQNSEIEELNWRTSHETILGNLRRVLATNGCVCLCAPNRWDYRRLLRGNNEDTDGRSGNLRGVVQTYRRMAGHLLSPKRYLAVLRDAGFSMVQAYVAFPGCRMPRFVVPFDAGVYRYYRRHFTYPQGTGSRKIVAKLIARSGQDRFLESHLLITGVKS